MTLLQRLRGILTTDPHIAAMYATQTTYAPTTAEQLRTTWKGATIRDPVFRADMTRRSTSVHAGAVATVWHFDDGSVLTANDAGVVVR